MGQQSGMMDDGLYRQDMYICNVCDEEECWNIRGADRGHRVITAVKQSQTTDVGRSTRPDDIRFNWSPLALHGAHVLRSAGTFSPAAPQNDLAFRHRDE